MVPLDPEQQERRRRDFRLRLIPTVLVVILMLGSVLLPQVGVVGAETVGRDLLRASQFFVSVDPRAAAFAGLDPVMVTMGVNAAYLGMAANEVGLALGIASFWVLAADEVGRWMRRVLLVAGWFLALSAPLVVTGYQLLEAAGVRSYLGVAWVPTLLAGLIMITGGLAARKRLTSTWYWSKPELIT
jgi:hypothetical protein